MIANILAGPRRCSQCERDQGVAEIMGGHYAVLRCGHAMALSDAEIAGVREDLKARGWKAHGGRMPVSIRG